MPRAQEPRRDEQPRINPALLPLPSSTRDLFETLLRKRELQHPSYLLDKFVRWHEAWSLRPPPNADKNSPLAGSLAFQLASDSINSLERKKICGYVLERRRNWLMPLAKLDRARLLHLTALTDVIVNLVSRSPLQLGLALHHLYGFPILPGSSLKGLARRSAAEGDCSTYGTQEHVADVAILEGIPVEYQVRRDVMTPHSPNWYQGKASAPDDTESPIPIAFLSVAAGSVFELAMIARNPETAKRDLDTVMKDLRRGLAELGLGAKTAAGYGVFDIVEVCDSRPAARHTDQDIRPAGAVGRSHSEFDEKIDRIRALPENPAGEIGEFVDWCLGLKDRTKQAAAAEAIVEKMGVRFVRDKARSKEKWRAIQSLADRRPDEESDVRPEGTKQ